MSYRITLVFDGTQVEKDLGMSCKDRRPSVRDVRDELQSDTSSTGEGRSWVRSRVVDQ